MVGMRRIICLFLIVIMSTCIVYAQKKEISQARDFIKKGKNLQQAEEMMTNLLKDSANKTNDKIWVTLFEAVKKQYEQGNEKLYLKQSYDTAAFFRSAYKMFEIFGSLDSLSMQPDARGRVKLSYREKNAEFLNTYRPNLYNGGAFFIKKQQYEEAYKFFDMYINSATQPLFKVYNYAETDKTMPVAAYWSVYCGYKLKDPKATLHHTYLALKDTAHYNLMLQYLAETYKLENDTLRYIETLHEGFEKYPKFPFFFPRLVEYYADNGMWKDAMRVCEMAMNIDSTDVVYRFATSNVYLNTGKYRECIDICNQLIAENDSLAEAYFNAGLGYFNQAIELDKANKVSNKRRQHILDFYKKALPYLQKYRELLPVRKDKWSLPLYTIYLNLNMGKEFDEIDKLIREERK